MRKIMIPVEVQEKNEEKEEEKGLPVIVGMSDRFFIPGSCFQRLQLDCRLAQRRRYQAHFS